MVCIPNYPEIVPWLLEYGANSNSYFKLKSGYKMYVMEHALWEYLCDNPGPRSLYCVKLLAEKKAYFDGWKNLKEIMKYNNYEEIVSILMKFLPIDLCKEIVYKYTDYKIILPRFNIALNILKENGYDLTPITT